MFFGSNDHDADIVLLKDICEIEDGGRFPQVEVGKHRANVCRLDKKEITTDTSCWGQGT